ncbi:MAG: hypothetical protein E7Z77_00310 [Methanobrevibacter sp.]|uniref:hypothetical protein n=1 Tax=Methanobrevibacter sp. TaxID=66852 RepID=UPI0025ECE40D|nr:hypothetical protein [Methanobrevibacter sp.]MBE6507833.1 hypothetical protein [Methanobrevibacter sp.]
MLTRRDIQLDLLQKLNELCQKANVKYVLHGQSAFLAYKEEPIDYMGSFEILMCQSDAEKIADILDDDKYYFEDFRSNPKFDEHYMMFGYKESLDLKIKDLNFMKSRNIDNHCIRINIRFIEHPVEKGYKLENYRRLFWKFRFLNVTTDELWYLKKFKGFINFIYGIIGEERITNHRYNSKRKFYSIDTWDDIQNYDVIRVVGAGNIKPEIFNDIVPKELDGVPSFIFKDFHYYASHYYGLNWEEKKWANSQGTTSSLISWDEFSKDEDFRKSMEKNQQYFEYTYANSTNLNENKILKFIKRFTFPESTKIYNNLLITRNFKQNVLQSGSILHNRDDYIEQKDELMQLYKEGNYEELEFRMKPLIRSMRSGVNLGYTYSVDADIDQLLDSYLRDTGEEKLADQIIQLRQDV